jgi:SulP family sulfate permease
LSRYGVHFDRYLPQVARLLPFLSWLRLADRESLRADALAGLIGATIALPQGVAFATLAGLPPEYGLYAAMIPAIVAALFGSSLHMVSGPANALSILLFTQLAPIAEPFSAEYVQLALTVAALTGVLQLALGLGGMGMLVNFISHSVIVGFTAAAGLIIIGSQLPNFLGVEVARGGGFFTILHNVIAEAARGRHDWAVAAVGAFTIAIGVGVRHALPRIPYMIVAVVTASLFAAALSAVFGEQRANIPTLGELPGALPALSSPDFSLESLRRTIPIALGMTLLGLTQALGIARAIAIKSGQRIDSNQEFIGQGLANIAAAFFSGYPGSGSFNRSGANYEAGARSPLANVVASAILVAFLSVLGPLVAFLPMAAMAGLLILVGLGLIDIHHIRQVLRTSPREGVVMLATLFAGLIVNLEFAIVAGVLFSLIIYLQRTSRPLILDVKPDPGAGSYHFTADSGLPDCPQIKMVRINGSLYFGAVDHVARALADIEAHNPRQKHLVIVASGINFIDVAGAEMLVAEAQRRRAGGGGLYFYRLKDEARALLARGGYQEALGEENIFPVKHRVVAKIYPQLDPELCRTCRLRIFAECQHVLPNGEARVDAAALAR